MQQPERRPETMRTFLVIWLGQLISIIGSGLTSFALGVWMYERTGRATPFALTVLFANLPRILLSPIAGSLADRWNRRWLMMLSDTGNALVTVAALVLVASGRLQVWHVYAIATAGAAFAAFQEPAYTASITMLVPKASLARANGLVMAGQAAETLISPLLAGLLLGAIGMGGVVAIDFITFFFAVGTLLVVRIPQPKVREAGPRQAGRAVWREDLTFGWRYLRARPGLLGLLGYFALVNFLLNFAGVLSGPLVLAFGTAATLGIVQTVSGLGMLAGSLVMSSWGGPRRRIVGVIGFIGLGAGGILLIGLRPSVVWVSAGMGLLLFCIPLASGSSQAIFQTKVAPETQGRVFAVRSMVSRSMMPLAFLLAGPVADVVFEPLMRPGGRLAETFIAGLIGAGDGRGIGLIYVLAGLLLGVTTLAAWANPRIRRIEDEIPDAEVESADAAAEPVPQPAEVAA